jgi:hypothetical protein
MMLCSTGAFETGIIAIEGDRDATSHRAEKADVRFFLRHEACLSHR